MRYLAVEKRERMLYLAISVAIIGTAALYALSFSMEEQDGTLTVKEVLSNPQKYLNQEITVSGNISNIREYGNTTVFYLRDGNYSLRCVYFGNESIHEGESRIMGHVEYDEEWGNYQLVVENTSSASDEA